MNFNMMDDSGQDNNIAQTSWENYERNAQSQAEQESKYQEQQEILYPRRRLLHKAFILYSIVSGATAVLLGIAQFLVSPKNISQMLANI